MQSEKHVHFHLTIALACPHDAAVSGSGVGEDDATEAAILPNSP